MLYVSVFEDSFGIDIQFRAEQADSEDIIILNFSALKANYYEATCCSHKHSSILSF